MYKYNNNFFFLLLYSSLIIGFSFGENLNYGSQHDWEGAYIPPIKDFAENFIDTLLNYEIYGQRHSPFYLVLLSFFYKLGLSLDVIRIIHLHLCISLIFIFYKCLKLQFNSTDKKILQLLSLIIFLSPTYRSLSIWPDSRLPGLIFFVLCVYYFLKFLKKPENKNAWLCSISLIFASYISPNYSLFSIYFYFIFFRHLNINNFFLLMIFNLFAALPMLYYLFILDINFLIAGKTPGPLGEISSLNFNLSNKILIISSIIFFHLIPVFFYTVNYKKFLIFIKSKIIYIFVILLVLIYFFNYQTDFTGGGFFYQLSNFLFNNNLLFFLICFFSISLFFYLSSINFENFLIISLLIISNVQNSIYHKYYEPLIIIIFFILFKNLNFKYYFSNFKNLLFLYFFGIFFIILRVIKNVYFL